MREPSFPFALINLCTTAKQYISQCIKRYVILLFLMYFYTNFFIIFSYHSRERWHENGENVSFELKLSFWQSSTFKIKGARTSLLAKKYLQLYSTKYFGTNFNFWTNFQLLSQCGCASPPTNLSGHLWSSKRNFVKSPTRARNLHSLHFHAIFHGCDMKYATKIRVEIY